MLLSLLARILAVLCTVLLVSSSIAAKGEGDEGDDEPVRCGSLCSDQVSACRDTCATLKKKKRPKCRARCKRTAVKTCRETEGLICSDEDPEAPALRECLKNGDKGCITCVKRGLPPDCLSGGGGGGGGSSHERSVCVSGPGLLYVGGTPGYFPTPFGTGCITVSGSLQLSAQSVLGRLVGWSEPTCGTASTCDVPDGTNTVTAFFEPNPSPVFEVVDGVTPSDAASCGATAVTSVPAPGQQIVNPGGTSQDSGPTSAQCQVASDATAASASATFDTTDGAGTLRIQVNTAASRHGNPDRGYSEAGANGQTVRVVRVTQPVLLSWDLDCSFPATVTWDAACALGDCGYPGGLAINTVVNSYPLTQCGPQHPNPYAPLTPFPAIANTHAYFELQPGIWYVGVTAGLRLGSYAIADASTDFAMTLSLRQERCDGQAGTLPAECH